jgi:hypothetical protein
METIESILLSEADPKTKARQLIRLAVQARDADDEALFSAACAAVATQMTPSGTPYRPSFSNAFMTMYEPSRRVIHVVEKYGDTLYEATGPEALAKICLMIVRRRREEGFWYDRSMPYALRQRSPIDPLLEAFLGPLLGHPDIADPDPGRTVRDRKAGWTTLAAQLLGGRVNSDDIFQVLDRELEAKADARAAFLAFVLTRLRADEGSLRRYLVARADGPLCAEIVRGLEMGAAERADAILEQADRGEIREAGREALLFLSERSDHQYERVHLKPVLDADSDEER